LIGLPSLSNFEIVRLNCTCTGLIPFFYQSTNRWRRRSRSVRRRG